MSEEVATGTYIADDYTVGLNAPAGRVSFFVL